MKKILFLFTFILSLSVVLVSCGESSGNPYKYRITFDSNGGSEVTPIVAEKGVTITAPADPVREGYEFIGWFIDDREYVITTMPNINITLVAKWEQLEDTEPTVYTITFDEQGGTDVENISGIAGSEIVLPIPTKDGYNFLGWYLDETKYETTVMEEKDIILVAKWEEVVYTITFDEQGGTDVDDITGPKNSQVVLPTPTKEGYNFLGWYLGEAKYESTVMGEENIILVAKWEEIPPTEYTITYDYQGGELAGGYATREEMVADFLKDFGTFAGMEMTTAAEYWSAGAKTSFWKDAEMHAKWSWIFKALIPFATAQGESTQYLEGMIADPVSVSGYATQNVAIYLLGVNNSLWNETYKATYGGLSSSWTTVDCTSQEVLDSWKQYVGIPTLPETYTVNDSIELPKLAKDGYNFLGWYLGETKVEVIAAGTTGNLSLVAKFEEIVVTPTEYTITLDVQGGSAVENITAAAGATISLPTPTKEGYTFLGWYLGETKYEETVMGNENITLVAKWEEIVVEQNEYDITYDLSGGAWQSNAITTHAGMAEAFMLDYTTFIQGLGYTGETVAVADFMDVSYNYGNLDDFFDNPQYSAKWAWVRTNVVEYCAKVGDQYASNIADKNGDYHNTILRGNVHGFLNLGKWDSWPKSADYSGIEFSSYEENLPEGEIIQGPDKYEVGQVTVLPTPLKEGYEFVGWLNNGVVITEISAEQTGDLELVAKWRLPAAEITTIKVGPNETYKTIAAALAVADEGTVILVASGTYDEDLVIKTNGIILKAADASLTKSTSLPTVNSIKIEGDNVTVDGFNFALFEAFKVAGNNTVIQNCTMNASPTAATTAAITIVSDVNGFTLLNSTIHETGATTHTRAILSDSALVTNILIKGNSFKQDAPAGAIIDCIKLRRIAGDITIEDNVFDWPGDNWTVFLADLLIDYYAVVNFNNNTFASDTVQSGVTIQNIDETTKVYIQGNSFSNVGGTVLRVNGTAADTVIVNNNAFVDTSAKIYFGNFVAQITFDNNYIYTDANWSGYTPTVANPAVDANSALNGVVTHYVSFDLGRGTLFCEFPETFVEGGYVSLNNIIPTYIGYRFLGWYSNSEFTGDPVVALGEQTADVVLYAKYEVIPTFEVLYELGGDDVEGAERLPGTVYEGRVLELPTLTRFGATFLGWSTDPAFTSYITSITVTEDVTLYAHWTTEDIQTVTYEFNGGNLTYENLDAVKADFDVDYKALTGNSNYSIWINSSNLGNVFTQSNHKWDWLLEYWAAVNPNSYGGNTNASVFLQMKNQGTCPDYYFYGVEITSWYYSDQRSVYSGTMKSANYANFEIQDAWWSYYSEYATNTQKFVGSLVLPTTVYNSSTRKLVGWYDNPEFTGEPLTEITESMTVYAKWEEATPVESITIDNKVVSINRYTDYQLVWTINPSNAAVQTVVFNSSNPEIASIDENGHINALANGTTTITITSKSGSAASDSFELTVVTPGYFEANYASNSYVEIEDEIQLNASYYATDAATTVAWSSLNPEIATVNENGVVLGLAKGVAVIRATSTANSDEYIDITVTVIEAGMSEALQFVLENHESNIFTRYELGIGAGTPVYYADIYGSVSKLLYNHPFTYSDKYLAAGNASNDYYANAVRDEGLEFVTVHYTAGMLATADSDNHASYFSTGNADVSIHYVTGNKGNDDAQAEVYKVLDHEHGAWHAGDSTGASMVGTFKWIPTGVAYDGADLTYGITWSASNDFYFEINGKKTTIALPSTYNYKERNTDHIYNADGTISSQADFTYSWAKFTNRTPESFFNDMGFAATVIDGYYYMAPTWWSFGQVVEGRICSVGGNRNSIGIESCVNEGSDLWLTWQVTAQLVANLLKDNNLDVSRVKGHHFFDGKDCPQPLLENDLEIWKEFLKLVEAELAAIDEFEGYTFTFKSNSDLVDNQGRVVEVADTATCVTYEVTVSDGTTTETITLGSIIPGIYEK